MGIPTPAFVPYPYFFPGPICLPVEIPLACAKHRALSEGGETNGQYLVFKCGLCDALLL